MSNDRKTVRGSDALRVSPIFADMRYTSSYLIDGPAMAAHGRADPRRIASFTGGAMAGGAAQDRLPSLLCGERIAPDDVAAFPREIVLQPVSARAKASPPPLQDALYFMLIVSARLREVIEAVEPGQHQFIPVGLRWARSAEPQPAPPLEYYFMNVLGWFAVDDLYDIEAAAAGQVDRVRGQDSRGNDCDIIRVRHDQRPPLRASAFEGRALVREGSMDRAPGLRVLGHTRLFARADLGRAIEVAGVTGVRFNAEMTCV